MSATNGLTRSHHDFELHEIRVQGHLDDHRANWPDQAVAPGVLTRIRDLAQPIVSDRSVDGHTPSAPGPAATMTSPVRLARMAGLLYLLVGITGGFAEGFVEPTMYVAGNAAATAANVVANAGLVRLGVVADLLDQVFFVFLAMTLYVLLKHVHQSMARAMLVFVTLAAGVTCLNTVFLFEGLRVATGAVDMSALGTQGSNAVVLLLLDFQHYGLLVAQIFFGLWLAPLGYLASKSGWFPRALCVLLVVAAACYLVDLLAAFLVPDFGQQIHAFVVIPCAIAEIWMVLYLLVKGVRTAPQI